MKENFISKVKGRCFGCGSCVAICKGKSLKLTLNKRDGIFDIETDSGKCQRCSLCFKVCPLLVHSRERPHPLGNVEESFIASSSDSVLRNSGSSGGVIPQILHSLFECGWIDAAVTVGIKEGEPLSAVPYIIRDAEGILNTAGSKYQPVPLNLLLPDLEDSSFKSIAIVGLPCHLQGIRNYLTVRANLAGKVKLLLGIFCSHNVSLNGTKFMLDRLKIKAEDIVDFKYRAGDWPGKMSIETKEGKRRIISNDISIWEDLFQMFIFAPRYCLNCNDNLAECADISCGDAWLKEELDKRDNKGASIVLVRSDRGKKLFGRLVSEGKLNVKEINPGVVISSQLWPNYFKKMLFFSDKSLPKKITDYALLYWTKFNALFLLRICRHRVFINVYAAICKRIFNRLLRFNLKGYKSYIKKKYEIIID